jgi:polysaccharide export outer membrane protein
MLVALMTGTAALGCAPQVVPAAFQDEAVEESVYRIAPSDVLVVRVWKNTEISVEAPVLPDGTLSVPLAGSIFASGLTTSELEDAIAAKLTDYIATPEVSVIVTQVNSKRVSMVGELLRAGQVDIGVNTRVMDALSTAGGFTPFANRKRIKIIRRTETGEEEFTFNYDAYVAGGAAGTNVRLEPGDVVVVPD